MYIKTERCDLITTTWDYYVYAANHQRVLFSYTCWASEAACIRAAKKMARRLGIEYRENREVK